MKKLVIFVALLLPLSAHAQISKKQYCYRLGIAANLTSISLVNGEPAKSTLSYLQRKMKSYPLPRSVLVNVINHIYEHPQVAPVIMNGNGMMQIMQSCMDPKKYAPHPYVPLK
jgi:hypothetical protein